MKFPSKVTSYKESSLALFPVILKYLEILDCLYALNKIELEGGVLHYVG